MSTIPTTEPTTVTAGDTLSWQKSLPDYPATAGWVLSYALLGSAGKITITGTAADVDHLVSVPAATSANYAAGGYQWQSYVTHATLGRVTIGNGSLTINKNFAALSAATDTRSHVKRMLDAIEAVLEGTATTDQQEYTIDGTTIKRRTVAELLALRSRYLQEYQAELTAGKLAAGLSSGNRILVRFK